MEYSKGEDMIAMFPDLIQIICKRPDYLRGRPIVRLPLSDFNCDHDYYYYVYEDDENDANIYSISHMWTKITKLNDFQL